MLKKDMKSYTLKKVHLKFSKKVFFAPKMSLSDLENVIIGLGKCHYRAWKMSLSGLENVIIGLDPIISFTNMRIDCRVKHGNDMFFYKTWLLTWEEKL